MNFIQRFLNAWQQAKDFHYFEAADTPDFWTVEDGLNTYHFFQTESGQKLKARLSNYVLQSAVEATGQITGLSYHCGRARGIAQTVATIQNHFAIAPAQESENTEEAEGTTADLEMLGA